jgi:hypothetical protein
MLNFTLNGNWLTMRYPGDMNIRPAVVQIELPVVSLQCSSVKGSGKPRVRFWVFSSSHTFGAVSFRVAMSFRTIVHAVILVQVVLATRTL